MNVKNKSQKSSRIFVVLAIIALYTIGLISVKCGYDMSKRFPLQRQETIQTAVANDMRYAIGDGNLTIHNVKVTKNANDNSYVVSGQLDEKGVTINTQDKPHVNGNQVTAYHTSKTDENYFTTLKQTENYARQTATFNFDMTHTISRRSPSFVIFASVTLISVLTIVLLIIGAFKVCFSNKSRLNYNHQF